MRIGIDVDGVLAGFVEGFTDQAVKLGLTDHAYTSAEQQIWKFPFETKEVWKHIRSTHNWWSGLPLLLTDAEVELLNQLTNDHSIYYITSRPHTQGDSAELQVFDWLTAHGIDATIHNIVSVGSRLKSSVCDQWGIELAIDDHVKNLKDYQDHGIVAVARTWPYNMEWEGDRVDSLQEFIERYCEQ